LDYFYRSLMHSGDVVPLPHICIGYVMPNLSPLTHVSVTRMFV